MPPSIARGSVLNTMILWATRLRHQMRNMQTRLKPHWYEGHHVIFGCCQRTSARKTPAISIWKSSCKKLATHVQILVNLYQAGFCTLSWLEKHHKIRRARFSTQSCSRVGQLLLNCWKLQGSSLQWSSGNTRVMETQAKTAFGDFIFSQTQLNHVMHSTCRSYQTPATGLPNNSIIIESGKLPGY